MSHAHIIDIESAFPQIPTQFDTDDGNSAVPVANTLEIFGATVANATHAKPLFTIASGNTVTADIQVGTAIGAAPPDRNDAGLVSFHSAQFSVDANGFVQLAGGGLAMDQVAVDAFTAPGTNPVLPAASGQVTIGGASVAAHGVPLETHSRAANAFNIEVQVASAVTGAPGNNNAAGVAQFNDTHFSVNANGYVSLIGGQQAIDQVFVDFSAAPGTNPVVPNALGQITVSGSVGVAGLTPVITSSTAANTYDIEVQVASAIAGPPANSNNVGLCSFDNTSFAVDPNGYVTLVGGGIALDSLTGDDGVIVGPDGTGDIDLIGSVVANAANAKPVFFNGNAVANSQTLEVQLSTERTGAPANSNDAGICSFDDSAFSVDANGYVELVNPVPYKIGAYNLGIFYSSPTATIRGADGNNLSASNPGYLVIPSNVSAGELVTYTITSNYTFQDAAGTSPFAGSLFGFNSGDTTSTAQAEVPFYIFAAADSTDANPQFFISRLPSWPALTAANLFNGASGSADSMDSILCLQTVTIANYNNSQSVMIGYLLMDINGSNDWTYSSANLYPNFNEFNSSILELGIYGAAASSHFSANGGTAPTVSTNRYYYKISPSDNTVNIDIRITLGGAPAGAVDALINIPLFGQNGFQIIGHGIFFDGGAAGNIYPIVFVQSSDESRQCYLSKADGTTARWQYNEFASGDLIYAQFSYRLN